MSSLTLNVCVWGVCACICVHASLWACVFLSVCVSVCYTIDIIGYAYIFLVYGYTEQYSLHVYVYVVSTKGNLVNSLLW